MWLQIDDELVEDAIVTLQAATNPEVVKLGNKLHRDAYPDPEYAEFCAQLIGGARRVHQSDGECEIDDDAVISEGGDPGAYVMAWVWVDYEDAGIPVCESCDQPLEKDGKCLICDADPECAVCGGGPDCPGPKATHVIEDDDAE